MEEFYLTNTVFDRNLKSHLTFREISDLGKFLTINNKTKHK